jgi:hypothetical protein
VAVSIETATYLDDLNSSLPAGTDDRSEGDNHIRLIKAVLKSTFPNITGAVTATHTDINAVTTKADTNGETWTGTHDFTGATVTVPTATTGDNTTKVASTAFVAAAVAAAASGSAPTLSVSTSTSITAAVNTHYVLTSTGAAVISMPSASAGDEVWVTVANGRVDNRVLSTIDVFLGVTDNLFLDAANITVRFRYINVSLGWWPT